MKIFLWGIVVIKIKRNKGAQIKRKIIIKLSPFPVPFPFGGAAERRAVRRERSEQRSRNEAIDKEGLVMGYNLFFPF